MMQTDPRVNLSHGFLRLPRELRDMIYKMYVTVDGGYKCDSNTLVESKLRGEARGRLTQASGEPIDLSLAYTCRGIADEMRGLALQMNVINFSTFYSDNLRCHLASFAFYKKGLDCFRAEMFRLSLRFFTGPVYGRIAATYPQFVPALDHLRAQEGTVAKLFYFDDYGEAPSTFKEFMRYALELAASQNGQTFAKEVARMCHAEEKTTAKHWKAAGVDVLQLATYDWATSRDEKGTPEAMIKRMLSSNRSRYRLSAASLAVSFLGYLPMETRKHIRNVVLHEDRQSVLDSACHARGLIPYCQENHLLRIERRANLWWNVFQQQHSLKPQMRVTSPEKMTLFSKQVTKEVAVWVVEASILTSVGMPPGSFSLVLDAGPAPQLAEALFQQVVQRDIAWHLARDEAVDRGHLSRLSWTGRRRKYFGGYTFESFPQAMKDIASQKSVIRLTFDAGNPWNVDELVEENRAYGHHDWGKKWDSHDPKSWSTVAPLPRWKEILMDNVVSWEEINRLRMVGM